MVKINRLIFRTRVLNKIKKSESWKGREKWNSPGSYSCSQIAEWIRKNKFNHDVPPQNRWHLMARCDGILAPMRACIISIAGLPSVSIARHDRRIEILIGGFLEKRGTRRTVQRFSSGSSALHTNAYMRSALFRDRSSWPTGRPRLTSDEYREKLFVTKHANSSSWP